MTDDGANESDNTHTVVIGASLSLGNHRGESMARYRGHVSYSERAECPRHIWDRVGQTALEKCLECGKVRKKKKTTK